MKPHDRDKFSLKYKFGAFELDPQDPSSFRLLKDSQPSKIQKKQFDLLVCLVNRHGEDLTYEELIRAGWGYEPSPGDTRLTDSRVVNLHKQMSLLVRVVGKDMIENHKREHAYRFKGLVSAEKSRLPPPDPDNSKYLTFRLLGGPHESKAIEWLFGFAIIVTLIYLAGFLAYTFSGLFPPVRLDPRFILCLVQFLVVGGALIASFFVFAKNERDFPESEVKDRAMREACGYADLDRWHDAKRSAKDSLKAFLSYWRFLLIAWTGLYLAMVCKYALVSFGGCVDCKPISMIATAFNNCNSIAIALCFVVLDQPTIFRRDGSTTNLKLSTSRLERYGLAAIIGIALVETVVVTVLWYSVSKNWLIILLAKSLGGADVISGLAGGVTLALFVGRVQSKFLGPSTWLPLALYFYVALQSLYIAIAQTPTRGALIIECALILKCLLFLYVTWLFKSGRFLFYFLRVKTVYEHANPDWKNFFLNLDRKTKRLGSSHDATSYVGSQ